MNVTTALAGLMALVCIARLKAEIVYLEDINGDQEKRNLDAGLPSAVRFHLHHKGGKVTLNLSENKQLNGNAPIYEIAIDHTGQRTVRKSTDNTRSTKRFYQDLENFAALSMGCENGPQGPCERTLSGSVVVDGVEHTLEPVTSEEEKRSLGSSLGTPHRMVAETLDLIGSKINREGDHDHAVASIEEPQAVADFIDEEAARAAGLYDASTTPETDGAYDQAEARALLEKLREKIGHLREKRNTGPFAVELLLTLDVSIYNKFAELPSTSGPGYTKVLMREYYSNLINGVDLRYRAIQEASFYFTINGFVISESTATSPWTGADGNSVDALAALQSYRVWVNDGNNNLPNHDLGVLITRNDITYSGSSGTVGLAYVGVTCGYSRVSINEQYAGYFKTMFLLAHEIGHNMGSGHDSDEAGCLASDKYIMNPFIANVASGTSNIEPWLFSSCSIAKFITYAQSSSGSCMANTGEFWNQEKWDEYTAELPGKQFTANEQCEFVLGDGAVSCSGSNVGTPAICRAFKCQQPSGSCYSYVAAEGTPCGTGMHCLQGLCVEEGDDNNNNDTYVCEDSVTDGMTCADLTTLMGNSKKMCKSFFSNCCATCTAQQCKKDSKKIKGATNYKCGDLVTQLTLGTTCRLFSRECCDTCKDATA